MLDPATQTSPHDTDALATARFVIANTVIAHLGALAHKIPGGSHALADAILKQMADPSFRWAFRNLTIDPSLMEEHNSDG